MVHVLEEVAQLARVSRSALSRVVNEYLDVQPEARERAQEGIRESCFQPHAIARSLVAKRTQTIGMVIPEAATTLFTDSAWRLHQRLHQPQHPPLQRRYLFNQFTVEFEGGKVVEASCQTATDKLNQILHLALGQCGPEMSNGNGSAVCPLGYSAHAN